MKKNKYLFIIALLLVLISVLFLVNRKYTTLDDAESGFAIDDSATVTKIFMVDKSNRSVKLSRQEDGSWLINDEYLAHNYNIAMLLGTIQGLKVRYPVPLAARDNVIRRLASIARKVEIYQMRYRINLFNKIKLFPHEKLTRTYYVGDATQDNLGTFIQMEGAEQPYVVFLPKLRGFIYTRYSTNVDDWRDQTIFKTPIQNFASVKLEFLKDPSESFIVEANDEATLRMTNLSGEEMPYDTLRMLQFVTSFKDIRYESLLNNKLEPSYIDSITSGNQAMHIITLKDKYGKETVVRTYRKGSMGQLFEDEGSGASMEPVDLDRLYAYINEDKDFVLIQYFVFDKVLRSASYLQNKE